MTNSIILNCHCPFGLSQQCAQPTNYLIVIKYYTNEINAFISNDNEENCSSSAIN